MQRIAIKNEIKKNILFPILSILLNRRYNTTQHRGLARYFFAVWKARKSTMLSPLVLCLNNAAFSIPYDITSILEEDRPRNNSACMYPATAREVVRTH